MRPDDAMAVARGQIFTRMMTITFVRGEMAQSRQEFQTVTDHPDISYDTGT